MSEEKGYTKNDANKDLDRIIGWVNNCDNKASIILGTYGVMATILFTTNFIEKLKSIVTLSVDKVTFGHLIYLSLSAISIILVFIGLYKLVKIIVPNTDSKGTNSLIFFGSIAENKIDGYLYRLDSCSDADLLKDIKSQIYINSKICDKKFKNLKTGLQFSLPGIILFMGSFTLGAIFIK
jgi:hypothetical protein